MQKSKLDILSQEIEIRRAELTSMVKNSDHYTSAVILEKSQMLDTLIIAYYDLLPESKSYIKKVC